MTETEFLVLRLYGTLASWGDIAVGEVRPIHTHPTKSALIGLISACLGITREQTEIFSKMAESYGFAVADEGRKTRLRDFHTIQSAPTNKEKIFGTGYLKNRQRELSIPKEYLETSLSYRDYICDVIYTVAVWVKNTENVPYSLTSLQQAIREPIFVPYLGRKSCVLSRPMQPQIIAAHSPMEAIKTAEFYGDTTDKTYQGKLSVYQRNFNKDKQKTFDDRNGMIFFEGNWDIPGITNEQIRDEPLSRISWQFTNRQIKRAPFQRRSN